MNKDEEITFEISCKRGNYHIIQAYFNYYDGREHGIIDLLEKDGKDYGPYIHVALSCGREPKLIEMFLDYMYKTGQITKDPIHNNRFQSKNLFILKQICEYAKEEYRPKGQVAEIIENILAKPCDYDEDNDSDVYSITEEIEEVRLSGDTDYESKTDDM